MLCVEYLLLWLNLWGLLFFIGIGVSKTKWGQFKLDYSSVSVRQNRDNASVTDEAIDKSRGDESPEWYSLQETEKGFVTATTNAPVEFTRAVVLPLP